MRRTCLDRSVATGAEHPEDPPGPSLDQGADHLRSFLLRMGTETGQGAVGFVIDTTYLEIKLPTREEA